MTIPRKPFVVDDHWKTHAPPTPREKLQRIVQSWEQQTAAAEKLLQTFFISG